MLDVLVCNLALGLGKMEIVFEVIQKIVTWTGSVVIGQDPPYSRQKDRPANIRTQPMVPTL